MGSDGAKTFSASSNYGVFIEKMCNMFSIIHLKVRECLCNFQFLLKYFGNLNF